MLATRFFTKKAQSLIKDAIEEAEMNTSGEIRVHIDNICREDVLDRAAWWFEKLEMHRTAQRNGVLFYMAVSDRKFAILGDTGINAKTGENFWDQIKDEMEKHFMKNEFTEGLRKGILMAGEQLKKHFPYQSDDVNELSDEISFGDQL